jgi:hypothetical protein
VKQQHDDESLQNPNIGYSFQREIMKTGRIKAKVGSDTDSWCKCKRILAHTVEAMAGDKPARVICNTCKSQHSYKPHPLDGSSQRTRKREGSDGQISQPAKPPSNRYKSLLRAKSTTVAETYSPQNSYQQGDVLEHPTFGRGNTTAVKDGTKIEVLFESGSKTLIHGRRPSP